MICDKIKESSEFSRIEQNVFQTDPTDWDYIGSEKSWVEINISYISSR